MSDQIHDYSDFKDEELGDNLKTVLIGLADDMEAAEAEVIRLQKLLDEAKGNARRISEEDIPRALEGLEGDFNLPDGRVVQVTQKVRANISKDNQAAAHKWMDDNGHSALIKREFTIKFSKDEDKWADKFERDLSNRKRPLDVNRKKTVHHMTLESFVRQQLAEGSDIPKELFGVHRQLYSRIKR